MNMTSDSQKFTAKICTSTLGILGKFVENFDVIYRLAMAFQNVGGEKFAYINTLKIYCKLPSRKIFAQDASRHNYS